MAVSMFQITVPVYIQRLNGLHTCLKKAQAMYAEKKYDETTLLNYRIFPDMFHFAKQVQAATDHARNGAARLAGQEPLAIEANEKSLADLVGRVEKTIDYLKTFKPEQIDGSEEKTIVLKFRDRETTFQGLAFVLNQSLPNFYFHDTTAYNILRHNGVEVGKRDFMGAA
jgi:uncharacterized protein